MHIEIYPGRSAVESLYLSTDRTIDPKLLAAAQLYDREMARKTPPVALPSPARVRLRRNLVVALMAQEIIRLAASQGSIAIDDFRRLGLTDTQIEDARADAYGLAIADKPSLIALLGGTA